MPITVRREESTDIPGIYRVNLDAFGREAEADLVNALRACGAVKLSLVALKAGAVCGHIAFTEVTADHNPQGKRLAALAPMSVAPGMQHTGIGRQLIETGIGELEKSGYSAIVVLGHPGYYPRFGFKKASGFGLFFPGDVPESAFMVLPLHENSLSDVYGTVTYNACFSSV